MAERVMVGKGVTQADGSVLYTVQDQARAPGCVGQVRRQTDGRVYYCWQGSSDKRPSAWKSAFGLNAGMAWVRNALAKEIRWFERKRALDEKYLRIYPSPCAYCGAAPGDPCVTRGGLETLKPHAARRKGSTR